MTYHKKLIEVALPLEAINAESAREKSIRHGHPSTLHLWWARRPLAACRVVLFAQMVDDPSSHPELFPTEEDQEKERQRLFRLIEELVKWENINNAEVLEQARAEIRKYAPPEGPPPVLDPFAGGGSIPLEAQRLGLEAHASDLNPVAVLINKALIEIPPKFAGQPPVNPASRREKIENRGNDGDALQRTHRVAEGDGGGARGVSASSQATEGGNIRDALSAHARGGLHSSEYRRGLGEGIEQGESSISGDSTGLAGGRGDVADALRASGMVSGAGDPEATGTMGRGGTNTHDYASQSTGKVENRSEEVGNRSEEVEVGRTSPALFSTPSPLFPLPYRGARGLAEDVRYYGQWMRDEAEKRIGHLYPKVKLPPEYGGGEATVIAWLWARTVTCPNPACGAQMPLVRSFALSTKTGRQAWVEPTIDRSQRPPVVHFEVRTGQGKPQEGTVNRRGATCICCGTAVPFDYIRSEGKAGRMDAQLMAIVAEGVRSRIYLAPSTEHELTAQSASGGWKSDAEISHWPGRTNVVEYGLTTFGDLFTPRQLVALTTFSDLVSEARAQVQQDAQAAGLSAQRAVAYADAVATYLAFAVDKGANQWSTITSWMNDRGAIRETFARQAIPMVWDYAEVNPFSDSGGNIIQHLERIADAVIFAPMSKIGRAYQADARLLNSSDKLVISTDPPWYDNIGYADLSDFFYIWLRRSQANVYSELFTTLLVPKTQELVATPYRFDGDREAARRFFEEGLLQAFIRMREVALPAYPLTVYYAFKQAENNGSEMVSTGWETMLEGLVGTGFQITGTWPMRTESPGRAVALGTNALASSIVLVCRPRAGEAPMVTRRDFLRNLQRELPDALRDLQRGNIAPVDLAQASIGPGMAIYSRYSRVIEADGSPMRVRTALALINQALDEFLSEQEGEFDRDTRWALAWFEQFGFNEAEYGIAETLSKAKNTSVQGMVQAGFLKAGGGKVRLLRREELPTDWDPTTDQRLTVWEVTQQLIHTLMEGKGEKAVADLLARVGPLAAPARDLAYRLYTVCERKGWAQEALPYNALVVSWSDVGRMAEEKARNRPVQGRLI